MKQTRLWAHVWSVVTQVAVSLILFAALPASAQNLPSSPAQGHFSPWRTMHPSSFDVDMFSVIEQCERARPTEKWLTSSHCQRLPELISNGKCPVVWVPDGTRLDRLLGRVDGDSGKESKAWPRQEKQTGRNDRALLCNLGKGVYAYWFTGDKGKSCNNVAFVHTPPKPVVVAPPPPVVEEDELVCFDEPIGGVNPQPEGEVLFINSAYIESCCCGGNGDYVPSLYVDQRAPASVSQGSVRRCVPKSSLKQHR
ncbi:hypothetical protein KC902_02045 [Candidatus Kaiserbacteria bacterium]|nr:hypothetical protein [Candidatus Kaiserbacteria bacterium]USN88998.1 MAG: hypothetical protein H6780_01060 [Candidatus Nomurabacteria bacterium]